MSSASLFRTMDGSNVELLEQWRQLLREPGTQWRVGYSALELAHSWLGAAGIPTSIKSVLDNSGVAELSGLELTAGYPEYSVDLDTDRAPSENDLFALCRGPSGDVVMMVEGKVNEPFGDLVGEWRRHDGPRRGRETRLEWLCERLGVSTDDLDDLRYQLFHRTASALIEAQAREVLTALMLVHSFSPRNASIEDYRRFGTRLGFTEEQLAPNRVAGPKQLRGVALYLAWIGDVPRAATGS